MAEDEPPALRVLHTPWAPVTDAEGRSASKIQPYPPMVSPCKVCPARCCHTIVKASLPDVLRWCRTLDLPFFAGFWIEPSLDARRGFLLDRDPRLVDPDDGWPGRAEIRLRRRPGGACIGLTDVGGYPRCGVYAARPNVCRLYPISWAHGDERAGPEAILCPAPFAVTPSVAVQAEADAVLARRWWGVHEAVVAEWAAAEVPDRGLERGLGFLLERAADRLGEPVPEVALARGDPDARLGVELADRGIIPRGPGVAPLDGHPVFAGLTAKHRR